ncbi:NUMOD4 motif-containing HNH endonuclease [Mycobacteroides chelonae]|uniref:NUMOD4 motif-containing HNH endonuclease n=1 Tax=Mycobacteroides chelonae TaxID=1774 RepID=UPI000A66F653
MTDEEWRPIEGFDGYEVSDQGRVRSSKHTCTRVRKPSRSTNGYLRLSLSSNNIRKYVTVHRLVAEAFVPGKADGLIVCHNDGDKMNNRASNLRWDTPSSNNIDASRVNANPRQLLNEPLVKEIRELYETGLHTHRSLAAKFGVTHQAIRDLLIRKNYRWVA